MASTVIRVEEKTHAKLKSWADQQHKPVGQIVTELVEQAAAEKFWREMREDFERLRSDPVAWADYQEEAALFESGSADRLKNEPPYYTPEEEAEIEEHAKSQGW